MYKISFIDSLMEFNKRVLYQGTQLIGQAYDLNDLKNLLFFNSVFMNNMDEIFERHQIGSIINDYVNSLNQLIHNINVIIESFMKLKPGVQFTRQDSFERRFAMATQLEDQVMTEYYRDIDSVKYRFESGKIYYIGLLKDGCVTISHVDMKRAIYHEAISCKTTDGMIYWKTDDCIRDYIIKTLHAFDVVAVKVTTCQENPYLVTKVEYNGITPTMKKLAPMFGRRALMISNPYIYLGDIEQMISENIARKDPEETQRFRPIEALDLLEEDELIEYPLDSFNDYLHFLMSAVMHPETKEIYLTLYRIGADPSIFYILRDAVRKGINVHVNIELFARGEKINETWMEEMEEAGINVTTYAAGDLKVHAKITLVKFNNGKSVAQIGTGNYHTRTTTQYTDLSLMTSDDDICHQIEKVFAIFREEQEDVTFSNDLLVTRYNARSKLIELIDREADKEENGYICMKCNAIDDDEILRHLDNAAAAGCQMDLIVRGVCTWVPQEIGSTVRIKSIVWDKLEHSRIYAFGASNPTIYMGSLDLVTSKLNKRIETLVRINEPKILVKLCRYLNRYITDSANSWIMTKSGNYTKED